MTRRLLRPILALGATALVVGAFVLSDGPPASAASTRAGSVAAARPACYPNGTIASAPVNPLNGTTACSRGPVATAQRYEAAIAAAGLLVFIGATVLNRRRRRGAGSRRLGPPAPQR